MECDGGELKRGVLWFGLRTPKARRSASAAGDEVQFVINVKAAKQIGLTIPPDLVARANKVIK
jgi:hypothetical protein